MQRGNNSSTGLTQMQKQSSQTSRSGIGADIGRGDFVGISRRGLLIAGGLSCFATLRPARATAASTSPAWIGACPGPGASPASVVTKYGSGASLRGFSGGNLASVSRPTGVSNVHWSWKPTLGQTITDSQIKAAMANLRAGDIVEVWHESDVKYRSEAKTYGTAEAQRRLTQRLGLKSQFHDSVVRLRNAAAIPRVRTCNTWAGWSVDSTSSVNPLTPSIHCRADLLGIDMDGIPASDTFYPYAERQMGAKFVKAMADGRYTGWTVPEFCMPAVASDPTRQRRIAWFRDQVAKINLGVPTRNIAPPVAINWFDYPGIIGPEEMLTEANETRAWSTLVATRRTA